MAKKTKAVQRKPGKETQMQPLADTSPIKQGGGKLVDKVAIITGGDSGIGRATALLFAQEGADLAIAYLSETADAQSVKTEVEAMGRKCLLIKGDLSKENHCRSVIDKTLKAFGKINILINNAGIHWESARIEDISTKQLTDTFAANFYSCFWLCKFAMPHLKKGDSIINTVSVTAFRGSDHLLDYAATKGAMVSFTRSLSTNVAAKGIRVNAVAPGPIWTPLVASSFSKKDLDKFGKDKPLGRPGQPNEVATSFLFLASDDASYFTGQTLHPNGGEIVNA